MNGSLRNMIDSAVGYLLALVALAFGLVGWLSGMANHSNVNVWFLSAGILGILAVGVVLDEARVLANATGKRAEAALSRLLLLGAAAMGIVGFITGLAGGPHAFDWLWSSVILALTSVAVTADEGRRIRAGGRSVVDEIAGGLLSLLAIGLGVVGFLLGITASGRANDWLYAGVIAALAATAFMLDGERRATMATARMAEGTRAAESLHGPVTG